MLTEDTEGFCLLHPGDSARQSRSLPGDEIPAILIAFQIVVFTIVENIFSNNINILPKFFIPYEFLNLHLMNIYRGKKPNKYPVIVILMYTCLRLFEAVWVHNFTAAYQLLTCQIIQWTQVYTCGVLKHALKSFIHCKIALMCAYDGENTKIILKKYVC